MARFGGDLCRMSGIEDTPQVMRDLCSLTIPEVAAYFHEGYGLKASNEAVSYTHMTLQTIHPG